MKTKKLILFLSCIMLACIVSYFYLDRQLVWWLANYHSRDLLILKIMADQIPNVIATFVFVFYIYFLFTFSNFNQNRINTKLMIMANSVVTAVFLKEAFKLIFSRYWSATFICNNPSLLTNNAYGFNWLDYNPNTSFPSGHAALIFSFSTSMWFLFPGLRLVWALLPVIVVIGQLGMYYHFISDMIAGAGLGYLVAIYNYRSSSHYVSNYIPKHISRRRFF